MKGRRSGQWQKRGSGARGNGAMSLGKAGISRKQEELVQTGRRGHSVLIVLCLICHKIQKSQLNTATVTFSSSKSPKVNKSKSLVAKI